MMSQKGRLRNILIKLKEGVNPTDKDVASAFSELKERYPEVSDILFNEELRMAVYLLIRRGIMIADEDLFNICDKHDSLRKLAYKAVRLMDLKALEEASNEILAKDLERTLLGSYVLKRISGGRGGGT